MKSKELVMGALVVAFSTSAYAGADALKCQSGKNQAVGKYAACRLKAEGKFATNADMTAYSASLLKCDSKYSRKWPALEQKALDAGDPCPSLLDETSIENFTDACGDAIATALGGSDVFAAANLTAGNIKSGQTIFGVTGTLTLPASGQTTAYGTGSAGDVQSGSTLSYTDNGDGTISDNVTGLMWEKKSDAGGIHDKDNTYTWSGASYGTTYIMDGTISTTFLATLNAGAGFAGYTDWRIPTVKELQSIFNFELGPPSPMVATAFHQSGTCTGCSDVTAATCSCTLGSYVWSSDTYRVSTMQFAWIVNFSSNTPVNSTAKNAGFPVRAVRGGL